MKPEDDSPGPPVLVFELGAEGPPPLAVPAPDVVITAADPETGAVTVTERHGAEGAVIRGRAALQNPAVLPVDPDDPIKGTWAKKAIPSQRKAKRANAKRWRKDRARLARKIKAGLRCGCGAARLALAGGPIPEAYCEICGVRYVDGRIIPPPEKDPDV